MKYKIDRVISKNNNLKTLLGREKDKIEEGGEIWNI